MKRWAKQRGSLLVEVIIVTAIFGILGTGLAATMATSTTSAKQGLEHVVAAGYIKEGIEAVRSIRDQDWSQVSNGTHGLTTTNGYYEFDGTSNALDDGVYTRTITIEDVYRNGSLSGDIATSGVLDDNTKKVTVNVAWDVLDGHGQNIDAVVYVMNWSSSIWTQSLLAEFQLGHQNSTATQNTSDGEMTLGTMDATWANTSPIHEIDLAGGGNILSMAMNASADRLYTLAYSTSGDDINMLDISNVSQAAPSKIVGYEANNCFDVTEANGVVFVGCNESSAGAEVLILDGSDLSLMASIDLSGSFDARTVAVEGDTLVIGQEQHGSIDEMHFYDISNPSTPTLLGSTDVAETINDLDTSTSHAFAVTNDNAKEVIAVRISDYTQTNTLNLTGTDNARAVQVRGDDVYVGRDNGSRFDVALIDGADPAGAGMSVVSTLEVGQNVYGIDIAPSQQWAALATSGNSQELILVELSGFTQLSVGDTVGSDNARTVLLYGNYAYIGSESNSREVSILGDVSAGWGTATQIATVNKAGNHNADEVLVVGTRTYLSTVNSGSGHELFVYDTTIPSTPVLLGSFNVGGRVYAMDVIGNYAYLATSHNSRELDIIDVSTPSSMVRVGSYNAPGYTNMFGIDVVGTTAYLTRDASTYPEFYVVDVATPATPTLLGTLGLSSDVNDVFVDGSHAYVARDQNSAEMSVIDISTPTTPAVVASVNLSGNSNAETIDKVGSLLVIGRNGGHDLALLDVATPTAPSILSQTIVTGGIYGVALDGTGAVFLATTGSGTQMQRWDISTPTAPVLDGTFSLGSTSIGVDVSGGYAYYATSHNTQEFQIIGPSTPPTDYAYEGSFTSEAFDSGASGTGWNNIEWTQSGTGTIAFMIRTANSEANLEQAAWVGSDGTTQTAYSVSGESITTDPSASGTQWIQWKALLNGNGSSTPVLEDVSITY